ncbi:DNA replication and repair protein RecF [termite gut metagenome]|uniref:DNA replication and repair protein RecF n=1 Tax=termite gut metagenome TaxID=433724 RepID=A0A5J4S1L9_9ZZZZ
MKKISEIHINNFKFFPEMEKPIKIEGKNILIYGENGSGKSSIYWALYTLLECSNKGDASKIQRYFNGETTDSLINIYTSINNQGNDNSFIKIVLDDGNIFEVSYQKTSINQDSEAKEILMASDFLNYRLLQRTYAVKHTDEINLFSLFDEAVLPYVQFTNTNWHDNNGTTIHIKNASEIYKIVKRGPDKKYPKKNGDMGFPQKGAHRVAHNEFTALIANFEKGLTALIQNINGKVKPIIQDKLKFKITFHLEIEKASEYYLSEANYRKPIFKIKLIIDDFEGKGSIPKPQSFLNEARLSAIALSIRLAILEQRFQNASMKIFVLDDLMISLDMSNRDKVVKLILEEYAWYKDNAGEDKGYQTFILTHDRSLFTFIHNCILNLPDEKRNTWKLIEMYADDKDESDSNSFEKPCVFDYKNDFQIAYRHYKNHDYPAAANYLRKYAEEIFCEWLPEYCWKDKESKDKSNSKMSFRNILDNAINQFWAKFSIPCQEYKEMRKYLGILLNPLSHADVGVERYKEEIKRVIQIIQSIKNLHNNYKLEIIVSGGEEIQIRKTDLNGNKYTANYELVDSFYKLTDNSSNTMYSEFSAKYVSYSFTPTIGTPQIGTYNGKQKRMEDNYKDFIGKNKQLIGSANWMGDLYKKDGTKLI